MAPATLTAALKKSLWPMLIANSRPVYVEKWFIYYILVYACFDIRIPLKYELKCCLSEIVSCDTRMVEQSRGWMGVQSRGWWSRAGDGGAEPGMDGCTEPGMGGCTEPAMGGCTEPGMGVQSRGWVDVS